MKLNHINLAVTNLEAAADFLETKPHHHPIDLWASYLLDENEKSVFQPLVFAEPL
jgi:catechol 2,3-dioxygenase-like lactoylglutathione lyase family enzyme